MLFDNPSLIFTLILVCALMAASLATVAHGSGHRELRPWVAAMVLQSLAWLAVFGRNVIPQTLSIVAANLLMACSLAAMLAALCRYRGRPWPRAACLMPPAAAAAASALLADDFAGRVFWTSLVFIAQLGVLAWSLAVPAEMRWGRARWLLLGAIGIALPVLMARAGAAICAAPFATSLASVPLHPAQLLVFVSAMATSIVGSLGFVLMIMERTDREMRTLAMTDSLTQVCNRRAFIDRGESTYAAALRSGSPLALLMIDVDHFKRINDDYGHPAGDEVLVEIARVLAGRLRLQDTLGRYGGEEFCVIAPNTDAAGARILAESLRGVVEATPLTSRGLRVTVSIGITACSASCPKCRPNLAALLAQADAALYEAKRNGRNRDRGREGSQPPLPPNRAGGFPAHGLPSPHSFG